MSESIHQVVIVGGGAAGHTAAIYTARAGLDPVVFEGSVTAGGALYTTTDVENFPGFPEGIQGPELIDAMRKQAEKFGAIYTTDDIIAMDLTGDIKTLRDGDGQNHRARAVILATGSGYRHLNIPGEETLAGHGVSWCATCDGAFFKNKHVTVIGGGDSAMEEALFLTRFAATVTVVHRRDTLRASKIMQGRARAHPKIRFELNSEPVQFVGGKQIAEILLRDTVTGELRTLPTDGAFIANRRRPPQRTRRKPDRPRRRRIRPRRIPHHPDQPARCVRLRRSRRPHLPSSHHRRRHRRRRSTRRRTPSRSHRARNRVSRQSTGADAPPCACRVHGTREAHPGRHEYKPSPHQTLCDPAG
jgi:thioredoxin reductase (NADPH)